MENNYFTAEEENAIAIYRGKTRDATVTSMSNVSKYINNSEMQYIMNLAVEKLKHLTEDEFKKMRFSYTEL